MKSSTDTIAAPITPPGRGPVAVVRLSGDRIGACLPRLSPRSDQILLSKRGAVYSPLLEESGKILDYAIFTFFPGPNSFTGEDCLEIAVHGSPYIVRKLLSLLGGYGIRAARPGEFSERAFLNGKMDLSQVEAVADLISAETEVQARVARDQLEGKLSKAISDLGEPLRDLLAEVEAYIDFPDEDIEPLTHKGWLSVIESLLVRIQVLVKSFEQGRLCREGALVVLAGLPNAGKSSLLNALLGEERAIVTPIAGTTRDSIEELASLNGFAVRLCDTAGLLDTAENRTPDEVEKIGIERSWKKLSSAELVLFVADTSVSFEDQFKAGQVFEQVKAAAKSLLIVANKVDLRPAGTVVPKLEALAVKDAENIVPLSATSGAGIDLLRERISEKIFSGGVAAGSLLVTNERHSVALRDAKEELTTALGAIRAGHPPEIISFHLRTALNALSDIIGITYTDDILGRIFSKFCIGK